MFTSILTFIIVLAILVLAHEWGHFYLARRNGIDVEEFGIGFPPRAFGIKWKGVLYTLNWIPLGGFVKIKGESGEFKEDEDSFAHKSIWQRFQVLVAGVVMNVIVAYLIFAFGFMVGFPQVIDENLPASANVRDNSIQVVSVLDGGPASQSNIEVGDKILTINGQSYTELTAVQEYIDSQKQQEVTVEIDRNGEIMTQIVTPELIEQTQKGGIGVGLIQSGIVSYPIHIAIWEGVKFTGEISVKILEAFYNLFKDLIVKQEVGVAVSGPVGIAVITGQVSELGFVYILQFMALLSLNLAIINLLPIPALDGGRILFLLIEAIRRKPIDQKTEGIIHQAGFLLLMGLVVIITYHDLSVHGAGIWSAIKGVFGG